MYPIEYTVNITQPNFDEHSVLKNMPEFYQEMLKAVVSLNNIIGLEPPQNATEVKNQQLWENRHITSNGKSMYFNNWLNSGYKTMNDIIVDNRLITPEELIPTLSKQQNGIIEYFALLNAIPNEWKGLNKVSVETDIITENGIFIKSKSSFYYRYFINNISTIPTSQEKWEVEFNNENMNWNKIWYDKVHSIKHNIKVAQFNYKLLHRILACKKRLKMWNITTTDLCDKCHSEIESEKHMILKCKTIQPAWKKFNTLIVECLPMEEFTKQCFSSWLNIVTGTNNKLVDELISVFTFCIYKSCFLKTEKTTNHKIIWNLFKFEIKNLIRNEYSCNLNKAEKKWTHVKDKLLEFMYRI